MTLDIRVLALQRVMKNEEVPEEYLGDKVVRETLVAYEVERKSGNREDLLNVIPYPSLVADYLDLPLEAREKLDDANTVCPSFMSGFEVTGRGNFNDFIKLKDNELRHKVLQIAKFTRCSNIVSKTFEKFCKDSKESKVFDWDYLKRNCSVSEVQLGNLLRSLKESGGLFRVIEIAAEVDPLILDCWRNTKQKSNLYRDNPALIDEVFDEKMKQLGKIPSCVELPSSLVTAIFKRGYSASIDGFNPYLIHRGFKPRIQKRPTPQEIDTVFEAKMKELGRVPTLEELPKSFDHWMSKRYYNGIGPYNEYVKSKGLIPNYEEWTPERVDKVFNEKMKELGRVPKRSELPCGLTQVIDNGRYRQDIIGFNEYLRVHGQRITKHMRIWDASFADKLFDEKRAELGRIPKSTDMSGTFIQFIAKGKYGFGVDSFHDYLKHRNLHGLQIMLAKRFEDNKIKAISCALSGDVDEKLIEYKPVRDILTAYEVEKQERQDLLVSLKFPSIIKDYLSLSLEERAKLERFNETYPEYIEGFGEAYTIIKLTGGRRSKLWDDSVASVACNCRLSNQFLNFFDFFIESRSGEGRFGASYLISDLAFKEKFGNTGRAVYQSASKTSEGVSGIVLNVAEIKPKIIKYWE